MTTHTHSPKLLLIAGHWLGGWAWEDVMVHLSGLGVQAQALTLPGLDAADPNRETRSLSDQVRAIQQSLANLPHPVVIVAHSGSHAPVTMVLDQCPELVRAVVWVDSGPAAHGAAFSPDLPTSVRALELPQFAQLAAQASLEGLNAEVLARFREKALPQPGAVLRQAVELHNPLRYEVPTTFVCCSMLREQVEGLVAAGHPMFAEVAQYTRVKYFDLPTGHWPMWSRPAELARILHDVTVAHSVSDGTV